MTTTELNEVEAAEMKSKIIELQSALLFTDSASVVKLPTHMVSGVEIDAEGNIWFVIPRPAQRIEAFDTEMPAQLDFFRKGKEFFVKVKGVAVLVRDMTELESNKSLSAEMLIKVKDERVIAVKVKVQDSQLVDNTPKTTKNWLQIGRTQLSSWFF